MSRYSVLRALVPPHRLPVASAALVEYLHPESQTRKPAVTGTPGSRNLTRYVAAAVERECAAVASTTEGSRNHRLNIAAVKLGSLVGAGMLDEQLAFDSLMAAAETCGLPDWEAQKTAASGLAFGKANPRQIESKSG